MTLTDRHMDELKREQWLGFKAAKARYAKLLRREPRAIFPIAERAVGRNDRMAIVAIGEALIERDALGLKPLRRDGFIGVLMTTLVEEGRFEQALQVFDSLTEADRTFAKAWVLRARALAALVRLKDARQSLARALELDPKVRDGRRLMGLIEAQRALKPKVAEGAAGWADFRRLTEAYLELGLPAFASKLIGEALAGLPAPGPDDYEHGLAIFRAALPLAGPQFVLRQGRVLRRVAQDDRMKALFVECQIALGRPEEGLGPEVGGRDMRLQRALAAAAAGDLDEAIGRLGRLTVKLREDLEVRAALGFCVGAHVLKQAPFELRASGGPRRVFNLMPFNDEVALLKTHLAEMADWVDLFVIVESEVTFTGQPKPLHFEKHRHEFAAYADKIRHLVVGEHPEAFHSPWGRDFRQRDLAIGAISGLAAPDDLVLLTDVDEIIDRKALEDFKGDFAGLKMRMFRFFLNYRPTAENGPVRRTGAVLAARHLQRFGSSYARFDLARNRDSQLIDDAGWHFTSMCDPARLVAKINSYAHQERNSVWRDVDAVGQRLSGIRDGQFENGWERAEIDDSFPAYIREHQAELDELLISAPAEEAS